jgi:hypothetical protein
VGRFRWSPAAVQSIEPVTKLYSYDKWGFQVYCKHMTLLLGVPKISKVLPSKADGSYDSVNRKGLPAVDRLQLQGPRHLPHIIWHFELLCRFDSLTLFQIYAKKV